MQSNIKKLSIIGLGLTLALSSLTAANAMPVTIAPMTADTQSSVELVQYHHRDWERRRDRDRDRHHYDNRRSERTWRGHHGHREPRHGYRRHSDGYWYPLAAFGAAAIIGSAIANQPDRVPSYGSKHVGWCMKRFKTYRTSDNTYAPATGFRAQCQSPYSR